MSQQFRIPVEEEEVADRLTRFAELNRFVTERHGWITSLPGDDEVRLETLPGSPLPDELRAMGYDAVDTGEVGERILPSAITHQLAQHADGALSPVTNGSTLPPVIVMHHAGFARVKRFAITGAY